MAFEVFGAWSNETCNLFKHLIKRASLIHGINESVLHNYWSTRITMSLVKYNSKMLLLINAPVYIKHHHQLMTVSIMK